MSKPTEQRWPDNVPGRYFVSESCIDCDACRSSAPAHFTRNHEQGYSFVYHQPETPEEEACCQEALQECPVGAINDGSSCSPSS
jgi:ferredoxin